MQLNAGQKRYKRHAVLNLNKRSTFSDILDEKRRFGQWYQEHALRGSGITAPMKEYFGIIPGEQYNKSLELLINDLARMNPRLDNSAMARRSGSYS